LRYQAYLKTLLMRPWNEKTADSLDDAVTGLAGTESIT